MKCYSNKYTKTAVNFTIVAFFAFIVVPSFAYAIATEDNGSSAGNASAPAVTDNSSTASNASAPAVSDNGSSAGNASAPATTDNGSSAGNASAPAVVDNGSSAGNASTPAVIDNGSSAGDAPSKPDPIPVSATPTPPTPTPATTPDNGGAGSGGCSSGCGPVGHIGTGGGQILGAYVLNGLPALTNLSQCNYLHDYMRIEKKNNPVEVTKLQTFLKNIDKRDLDINGVFDQKTFLAVEAFQAKYVEDVLVPWGVRTPTGQVYYTTKKKINEIYCKTSFALTPAQIAEIEAYRNSRKVTSVTSSNVNKDVNTISTDNSVTTPSVNSTNETITTSTMEVTPDLGVTSTTTHETAKVGGFGTRVGSFFKWLFGYRK